MPAASAFGTAGHRLQPAQGDEDVPGIDELASVVLHLISIIKVPSVVTERAVRPPEAGPLTLDDMR
jgi:hypothetical protein